MLLPADWWNCLLWVWVADGIAIGQSFSCNLDVLYNTSSHMCGWWYLPIFLLRDGSLTLMNRASLIALVRFWSSLPIMLKFLMSALCPEMLQWSWMGEGDFWCFFNLSAKVLADSPIYSSLTPIFTRCESVYDPTFDDNWIFVLGGHGEIFYGLTSFEVYLYTIFLTSVFEPLT